MGHKNSLRGGICGRTTSACECTRFLSRETRAVCLHTAAGYEDCGSQNGARAGGKGSNIQGCGDRMEFPD